MLPQVLVNELATRAVDLWAAGCILFQLMTGDMPFHGDSDYLTFQVSSRLLCHSDIRYDLAFISLSVSGGLFRR